MRGFSENKRFLVSQMCCVALLATCMGSVSVAEEGATKALEEIRGKMIALFCANDGKLARCAGQRASDCKEIVKPAVDSCLRRVQAHEVRADGDQFERCFWTDFSKKYGNTFDYSEECFHADNKDGNPLQETPPELEKGMTLLNP